ncbi:MAG TPA: cupredoxin domain-containing protein [Beijerinckiaceae bacterium]|jgi:plastocyanin
MAGPCLRAVSASLLGLAVMAGTGGPAIPAGKVHRVEMKAVDFEPRQITVRVGDTVEWTNSDIVAHTATAKDRSWDVNVPARRAGRMVMKTAGSVSYFCRYHPNMRGEIVVVP